MSHDGPTPGPWTVTSRKAFDYRIFRDGGDCPTVAEATAIANAHLISAAPDLLEAAECALSDMKRSVACRNDPEYQLTMGALRDAITKAKGGD